MRQKIILILLVIIFNSCKNEINSKVSFDQKKQFSEKPLEQLKQVDKLINSLVEKPQQFSVPSNGKNIIKGAQGTVVYVDPGQIETIDGSPLKNTIQIDLIEMTDNKCLILNNAQTVSNGKILVTGGAYYLNMKSEGKQLRIKKKGLKVEFPKLTENEMSLFMGGRDSISQVNWIETKEKFLSKKNIKIERPKKPLDIPEFVSAFDPSEIDPLTSPKKVDENQVSSEEYKKYLKELKQYKAQKKQFEYQEKTYQSVDLLNFGWINCDRFYNDQSPKTNIQILVKNDSLTGARIYAVFKDMKSVMSAVYWKGQKKIPAFENIPTRKELEIIALSAKDGIPYIFEASINTDTTKNIQVNFVRTTHHVIKDRLKRMN